MRRAVAGKSSIFCQPSALVRLLSWPLVAVLFR
jgi:hypothetical protein